MASCGGAESLLVPHSKTEEGKTTQHDENAAFINEEQEPLTECEPPATNMTIVCLFQSIEATQLQVTQLVERLNTAYATPVSCPPPTTLVPPVLRRRSDSLSH